VSNIAFASVQPEELNASGSVIYISVSGGITPNIQSYIEGAIRNAD
jgi:hypothetical protein